jgi:hypothetical protein
MASAQVDLSGSLRDIEAWLRWLQGKLYHLGFRGRVACSTLADANESRDWRIFADFARTCSLMASLRFSLRFVCFSLSRIQPEKPFRCTTRTLRLKGHTAGN